MNDLVNSILVFIAGIAIGAVFFGGLWYTVQKATTISNPAVWFIVSFVVRMAIVVSSFYFLASDNWQKLLLCLGGFMIARFAVTKFTKNKKLKMSK